MVTNSRHCAGQLGNCIVSVNHGSVSGPGCRAKPQPTNSFFCGLNWIETQVISDGDRESSYFANGFGGSFKKLRAVINNPRGPVLHACFFIGKKCDDHISPGPDSIARPMTHYGQDHGIHVFHVHSTTSPNEPIVDLCTKRRVGPICGYRRHNIKMSVDYECIGARVGSRNPQVNAPAGISGCHIHLRVVPHFAQSLGAVVSYFCLTDCFGRVTPITGVNANQFLGKGYHVGLKHQPCLLTQCVLLRHAMIMPSCPPLGIGLNPSAVSAKISSPRFTPESAWLGGVGIVAIRRASGTQSGWRNR